MANNKFKILLIEDELNIHSFMQTILEAEGYQVLKATTGAQGKLIFRSHLPDLILLDLGLPDMDGTELIREIRSHSVTPILVLSARIQETDKVEALDLGANDYITKPFGTAELLARVRAALRSQRSFSGGSPQGGWKSQDLEIRYDQRRVFVHGQEVHLTQTEYNIVSLLALHSGKVMTYSAIITAIWGSSDNGSIKKLQVNMANIRKKLHSRPGENNIIYNELGVGYRMCEGSDWQLPEPGSQS